MKLLQVTTEHRAYTEDEAKEFIEAFRKEAKEKGYTVKSAGWAVVEKKKTKAGVSVIIGTAWKVKCVAVYDTVWDEGEFD